jgi:hypothetical protein
MPIEIRELQIRAAVGPRETGSQNQALEQTNLEGIKQEIIREVTEEVLKTIQLKLER